jgi:hypothetical protein
LEERSRRPTEKEPKIAIQRPRQRLAFRPPAGSAEESLDAPMNAESPRCFNMMVAQPFRSRFVLDSKRTIVEHNSQIDREDLMVWAKDIAAGAGLLAFVTVSFLLATVAQSLVGGA